MICMITGFLQNETQAFGLSLLPAESFLLAVFFSVRGSKPDFSWTLQNLTVRNTIAHTCNSSTGKVEAGQSQPHLHSEFQLKPAKVTQRSCFKLAN